MDKKRCESCGYAIWDRADPSVGMPACVSDCKAKFSSIGEQLDRMAEDDEYECPFHAQVNEKEWERIRCKECNSPQTEYIKMVDKEDYTANYRCKDCGCRFKADVGM